LCEFVFFMYFDGMTTQLDIRLNTTFEISCVTEISWLTQYESQNVTDIVDVMWLWTVLLDRDE